MSGDSRTKDTNGKTKGRRLDESAILSVGDVERNAPQKFDVFVSPSADLEDGARVVQELVTLLETYCNVKCFVPFRDSLPGSSELTCRAHLIHKRCRRVMVLLSADFHNVGASKFTFRIAHSLSPGGACGKVVPVSMQRNVNMPNIFRPLSVCDMTVEDNLGNSLKRLGFILRSPATKIESEHNKCSNETSYLDLQSLKTELSQLQNNSDSTATSTKTGSVSEIFSTVHDWLFYFYKSIFRDKTFKTGIQSLQCSESYEYDAYLSYEEKVISYVWKTFPRLEDDYNLRFYIPDRDLPVGGYFYEEIADTIEKKCKKVVILISTHYMECEKCDFVLKYALHVAYNVRKLDILPVLLDKDVEVPLTLSNITSCDLSDEKTRDKEFKKLIDKLRA